MICSNCLVGRTLPVRRDDGKWQFAEVLSSHDEENHQLQVSFPCGDKACVTVEADPFDKYFEDHRGNFVRSPIMFEDWFATEFFAPGLSMKSESLFGSESDDLMHLVQHEEPQDWTLNRISEASTVSPLRAPHQPFVGSTTPPTHYGDRRLVPYTPQSHRQYRSPRRSPARLWTSEDDDLLMSLVERAKQPIKWSEIAKSISDRNGKQCRERYLNHLRKEVKVDGWTPVEDTTICHLYGCYGSKWSMMTKVLEGRTDNGIKNRFHHIRRKLEKDVNKMRDPRSFSAATLPKDTTGDILSKARHIIAKLALDRDRKADGYFGPFVEAKKTCTRCHLFVPSIQTGGLACQKTGWCHSCAKTPPYVVGDLLRECHMHRKGFVQRTQ